ncbi:hypothetical protein OG233_04450 [Streptomyces sp. NBC_01218]|uniref:hypothetical protein n=1 Tax=Streptomyces sp. NBC_01218 TaxID=2903780 RepID=UPI002E143B09|nr:hypothetical protein OG233_04450 [Streptomyces sp. NBC_01218]
MNVIELLADLQAQYDETTAQASELRNQIEHVTADLTAAEARLADLPNSGRSSLNSRRMKANPHRARRTPPTRPS